MSVFYHSLLNDYFGEAIFAVGMQIGGHFIYGEVTTPRFQHLYQSSSLYRGYWDVVEINVAGMHAIRFGRSRK